MIEYLKTIVNREVRIRTTAQYDIIGVLLPISSEDFIDIKPSYSHYDNTRVLVKHIIAVSVGALNDN